MRNAIKVLVVDDDKSSTAAIMEIVKRMGFKGISVAKSSDALNIVRLQTVHAAIVDVLLPKMTGVDLVTEFRNTKFSDSPVIFISGVFKDKAFMADAIKKTGAVDFLPKPYQAEELMSSLRRALAPIMTAERFGVQSLLTRRFHTFKERAKAIEHLEPIRGLDFPYVLAFLLEAKMSGHLNIVNEAGEIFGVKLVNGTIADVDSAESQATGVLALISNGFLAQDDWDEYQINGRKNFPLERLVQEGYVSPHAVSVAKHEQILADFKNICSTSVLRLNFVMTEDMEEPPKHAVRMGELLSVFIFSIQEFFPKEYLAEFYNPVLKYPLVVQPGSDDISMLWNIDLFRPIAATKDIVMGKGSIQAMLEKFPGEHERVYQCLHLMVLNGWVIFQDLSTGKAQADSLERYKRLYEQLRSKSPDQIFEYFGASLNASGKVLENLLEEYSRANNPEHISKTLNPELYDYCNKCLDLVKQAYAILTDDSLREKMMQDRKDVSSRKLRESNQLTAEGLELLRKGQFQEAVAKIQAAGEAHPSNFQFLILIWAEIKAGLRDKEKLQAYLRKLDGLSADDRKSPYYFMALGLVKRLLGDQTANGYFEKALAIDSLFVEARRELNAGSGAPKKEKVDIFKDDLSVVVSRLFRRAKE